MDAARRSRGQGLDRIGLARHEDRFDAADLARQEQYDDLAPAVRQRPAARQPAALDRIDEFVRLGHLHQDVAAVQDLRYWGHGGLQLGPAAPQQRAYFRPRQRRFGHIVRQEWEPLDVMFRLSPNILARR